ncbi:metal-dependent hydrolase [Parasulfuritortus cantonensis]|uniref:Metal-dependent hydrolase n=1 Tax=Parasulfuritortus cantonensis TaxID=2528202 RepID=A0A4R1B2D7_9PROT|nr:metal-dependent hydrolase [Parasulfuritortus cantonensis]TCJ12222.1 metal-dependent hydrolase [Parasulfuritortus cantonensis]
MFVAHLPAGYLTARVYARHVGGAPLAGVLLAGMAGGLFPDLDLVYGALADAGAIHHHRYWTHLPAFWLAVSAAAAPLGRRAGAGRHVVAVFLLAVWGHLLLDSVAGDIWWLAPWRDRPYSLVDVAAGPGRWWLAYLLHWTFAVEMAIVAAAAWWEGRAPVLPALAGSRP